ncbi:MAG: type II toxin-antitoxin system VapC family toxin [Chthoniobacter sp.]|nr:type II toxin-antitoxin system VapC family toxin [Chthoniobacter sp.]
MSLPRLYLETTIPSYLTARRSRDLQLAADQQTTEDWWNQHRQHYECFVSPVVVDEVARGDAAFAAARMAKLTGLPVLSVNDAAQELTVRLLADGIIPAIAADDAAHLGVAAAHAMDFLLTWNCKHINNPHLIRRIERACATVGFACPIICTPAELMIP